MTEKKSLELPFLEKADSQRLATIVVMRPMPFVDSDGDSYTVEALQSGVESFRKAGMPLKLEHDKGSDGSAFGEVVESFLLPADSFIGGQHVPMNSWVMKIRFTPEGWAEVKKGTFNSVSMGGSGWID